MAIEPSSSSSRDKPNRFGNSKSQRRESTGSTREARRAGTRAATSVTATMTTTVNAIVAGSWGAT